MTSQLLNPPAPPAADITATSAATPLKTAISATPPPADSLVAGRWTVRRESSPLDTRYVAS